MLPADELEALAESIREVGLLEPLVLTADGQLLDGRNRLAACQLAKVEPTTTVYEGDPVDYVIGKNTARRHMNTGARAMATAVMLVADGRRQNGRWLRGTLDSEGSFDSWKVAMRHAGVVLDVTPDIAPLVIAGGRSLDLAYREAKAARDDAR